LHISRQSPNFRLAKPLPMLIQLSLLLTGAVIGLCLDVWDAVKEHFFSNGRFMVALSNYLKKTWPMMLLLLGVVPAVVYFIYHNTPVFHDCSFLILASCSTLLLLSSLADMLPIDIDQNKGEGYRSPGGTTGATASYTGFGVLATVAWLVTGWWPVFAIGLFGGFAGELIELRRVLKKKKKDLANLSAGYWIITVLTILASGVIATFYGIQDANPLAVFHIGVSAPLIIQRLKR